MSKQGFVNEVFSSVSNKYDLMNDLMSMGMHRIWKDYMVKKMRLKDGDVVLDVAGGTGDIARRVLNSDIDCEVCILDINQEMISCGIDRTINDLGITELKWICGNAELLPLKDKSIDVYSIAFGIRNVNDINSALREAYRVLGKGKRFICMEFGKVKGLLLNRLYSFYSKIIPSMGLMVANDEQSYKYLVDSIRDFPEQELFRKMVKDAGFDYVKCDNILGGIVAVYEGIKI